MKYDIFLSICQTEVDDVIPDEKTMFKNFFDQVEYADELGFGTAWVAETHLSTEVQKQNPDPVVPHFKGEIGLNTEILLLAQKVFERTKNINVGSAIRNIFCNGGPIAHAEAIKTFMSYHALDPKEKRTLNIGFASGRFEFSTKPYGIVPRSLTEQVAWKVVKGKILTEATEIFLRLLRGDVISSSDIKAKLLSAEDFRTAEDWHKVKKTYGKEMGLTDAEAAKLEQIEIPPYWNFDKIGVIPKEAPLELLNLIIGTHDSKLQDYANEFMPVSVFNLSITPPKMIEETHERMKKNFHKDGGPWQRHFMPRTAMVFLDNTPGLSLEEQSKRANDQATKAWENYWRAMEGTLDPAKVEQAVSNALTGNPREVAAKIKEKYHPEDRLMLWFDFNNHDNEHIKNTMKWFMQDVKPLLEN